MAKGKKRLTDEDMVIGGVGEDDGVAEQSGGVVCGGGGGWSHAGRRDALASGLLCGRHSVGRVGHTDWMLGFRFRYVLGGQI